VPLEPSGAAAATKVVANIPYNITGPLLERLLGRPEAPRQPPYERLVLLLQREVSQRIRARAGSSAHGALSVRLQLLCRSRPVCAVPPRCFRPPPQVHSEVILLEPRPQAEWPDPTLARELDRLLRQAFAARRKMLRNSLAGALPGADLEAAAAEAGIGLDQRPQEIDHQRWLALAGAVHARRQPSRPSRPPQP
jgi:16S rRNA (adenine1518-N6/adenine1519-N6)-dimethyltransferase